MFWQVCGLSPTARVFPFLKSVSSNPFGHMHSLGFSATAPDIPDCWARTEQFCSQMTTHVTSIAWNAVWRLIAHLQVTEYTFLKLFFQFACNNCFLCAASADMATLKLSVQQTGRPATWIHAASRHVSKRGQTTLPDSLPHGCFEQIVCTYISSVCRHACPKSHQNKG